MSVRHAGAAAGAATSEPPDDSSAPLVLVVDDTREIREWMASFLRHHGYRVLEAGDGLAAQSILQAESPALVICDLEMPLSDGWEVLTYCHHHRPATPVVVVSGSSWGRRPGIERWAAGFIAKPFRAFRFLEEVEHHISRPAPRRPH